jgi:2-polyprenyl-3-methyl-5-hydroxy-6-metoxy-1,4-benzoquinol methylase
MHGYGTNFKYNICNKCLLIQIDEIPPNLSSYYESYYGRQGISRFGLSFFLRKIRFISHFKSTWILGKVIGYFFEDPLGRTYKKLNLNINSRILDVGCADGFLPYMLTEVGYRDVTGIDPFIDSSKTYPNGTKIFKAEISNLNGEFDVITLNHVLEHLPEQLDKLLRLRGLLSDDGKIVLRIPSATSDAFEKYREFWYQFDAPRHLFLHSHQSINELLIRAGYKVVDMFCDSTIWQYYSSDLYMKNIPFSFHMRTYLFTLPKLLINGKLNEYKQKVKKVNCQLKGDQIVIVAKKNTDPN